MRLHSNGNVGIGTNLPDTNMNLHILDKTDRCYVTFESGGNESSQLWLKNPARTWKISNYYDQNALTFTDDSDERFRIGSDGTSTFDVGAPSSSNKVIGRFQAESSRQLDIVWHDSGSLMGFNTPGNHSYIFKCNDSEKLSIKSTGEVHISDRNTSNTGEHFFQAGAFGIRMEDTGGYNRWNIERNYGGYKSTPIIHLSTQGRVGINTFAPVSTLDLISTEALGSVIQRDFQGATNTTDASSKLALTIWGKNHYDSSYGSTGTDAYGPMIGFGGRVDGNVPNTGDIRAGISYKYNGDLTFHAEAGGNVTDGTNERFRIDGTNGHIITNGGVTELRGGRTYSTNSTSTWSTMLTFSNANNNGFALEIAVAENNYTTMYKVAGTAKWNSVSVNNELAGDTAHLHSKDIEFRVLNDSGTKRLQFKAVSYTTTRYLTVISVWCKSGYVTWS